MCFDRKLLLQVEQIAWDEFRHLRDSAWSPDVKITRAHDSARAASQKLRDHVAVCQECSGSDKFANFEPPFASPLSLRKPDDNL